MRYWFFLLVSVVTACAVESESEKDVRSDELALVSDTAPVFIDHALGVYSPATICALRTSSYLNERFVDVEVRTTVCPDITYTGTYLNTSVTYFEAFEEGEVGLQKNLLSLAVSSEVAASSEAIQAQWNREFDKNQTEMETISRHVDGVEIP